MKPTDKPYVWPRPNDPHLLNLAKRWLGNLADAEDAVQEAFARAVAQSFDAPDEPRAWLTTVLRRLVIDQFRHQRVSARALGELHHSRTLEAVQVPAEIRVDSRQQADAALRLSLECLSGRDVAILLLSKFFGEDYSSIASAAQRSEASCRQLVSRARNRIANRRRHSKKEEGAERAYAVCLVALQTCSPQPLYELLRQSAATAVSVHSLCGTLRQAHALGKESVAVTTRLALVDGRLKYLVEQDGQVLCSLPTSFQSSETDDENRVCGEARS